MLPVVSVVLAFFALTYAHNWCNSPSRSAFASSVAPTLPSSTGLPHVQVIAGQSFQIEWVQGHTGFVYWMFLAAKDQANLILHQQALMDAYIAASNVTTPPTGRQQQWTRQINNVTDYLGYQNVPPVPGFYVNATQSGTNYIPRDAVFVGTFTGKANGQNFTNPWQLTIPASYLVNDRQVWYHNPTYPWLVGGSKYNIAKSSPEQPNVAEFAFPVGTPPGAYMAHYRWSGYWDVVDIEIIAGTTPVANPYGLPTKFNASVPPVYQRVPHCEFTDPGMGALGFTVDCTPVVGDASGCLAQCARLQGLQCIGVNVVSLVNRPQVRFNNTNIPFGYSNCVRNNFAQGANASVNTKVCYGIAGSASPSTTDPPFYTTDDPEDPAFESTCYIKLPQITLQPPPPAPAPPPALWDFDNYCVDCGIVARNQDPNFMPIWPVVPKSQCSNCDVRNDVVKNTTGFNSSAPVTNLGLKVIANNTQCDGLNGAWTVKNTTCATNNTFCSIQLAHPGNSAVDTIFAADAIALAKANPACDQTNLRIMLRAFNPNPNPMFGSQLAQCASGKNPCCTCTGDQLITSNGWTLYQVT